MAKDTEPLEKFNANAERAVKQAEQVVEKTVDHTRGVLDDYFRFMQKAFSSYPVGGTELAEKMKKPHGAQHFLGARIRTQAEPS